MSILARLWKEESGQGMAEYGLILALVAVVCIGGLLILGPAISDKFKSVGDKINEAAPAEYTQ